MKKIFSIIAICLALVLVVPAVPVNAANISRSNIFVRTRTSIGTPWPDYAVNQNFMLNSVWLEDSFVSAVNDCLDNFDYSLFSNYDYYWLSAYSDNYTLFSLQMILFNSSQDPLIYGLNVSYNQQTAATSARSSSLVPVCDDPHILVCSCQFNSSGMVSSQWTSDPLVLTSSFGSGGLYYNSQTVGCALLDTNCGKYWWSVNVDALWANNDHQGYSNKFDWCLNNQDRVTNYWDNFPGYNSQGSLVDDPSSSIVEVESNSNHLYFQSCDLGFCEPTGITNFESFGGAYLYCKYTVDNWIVNHINDYQLRFNVVSVIGSEQNNFSYTMRLDRNGYVTVPFSSLFVSNSSSAIPVNRGFAAVVSPQKLNNDYNIAHLYSVANENVPNFVSEILDAEYDYNLSDLGWSALRGGTLKYIVAWVSDHGTKSLNNTANWAESITQSFNPYVLRIEVKLIVGEEQSSGYAEKFDLYTGDQTTVDTGGLVNPDPFVPDVDQDDGDLPSPPQDPNSTTPSTIVYTGGVWQGTINGVIGYDPGYRELKEDLDKDPDGNFTQYLDPMKNQTVGSWFLSFVNDMPSEMKALLITGTGVGIFFGIYRFIRRG